MKGSNVKQQQINNLKRQVTQLHSKLESCRSIRRKVLKDNRKLKKRGWRTESYISHTYGRVFALYAHNSTRVGVIIPQYILVIYYTLLSCANMLIFKKIQTISTT